MPMVLGYIHKVGIYWSVETANEFYIRDVRYFIFPDGAFKYWRDYEQKAYYRIRAREIATQINYRTLEVKEQNFIGKMIKKNWYGCTKKQYGYLKGIQERNSL